MQIEQNGRGKTNLLSWLELGHPSFPALGYQCFRSWVFRLELGLTPLTSVSQVFRLGLGYTTSFPGPSTCSLCICLSQFLIVNSFTCIKTLMDYFAIILLLWATLIQYINKVTWFKNYVWMYMCLSVCEHAHMYRYV